MAASGLEQAGLLSMSRLASGGHILKSRDSNRSEAAGRWFQGWFGGIVIITTGMGETKEARCSVAVVASATCYRFEWLRLLSKQVGHCLARWRSTTNTCAQPTRWPSKPIAVNFV
jgi:hypothetical protein